MPNSQKKKGVPKGALNLKRSQGAPKISKHTINSTTPAKIEKKGGARFN